MFRLIEAYADRNLRMRCGDGQVARAVVQKRTLGQEVPLAITKAYEESATQATDSERPGTRGGPFRR